MRAILFTARSMVEVAPIVSHTSRTTAAFLFKHRAEQIFLGQTFVRMCTSRGAQDFKNYTRYVNFFRPVGLTPPPLPPPK